MAARVAADTAVAEKAETEQVVTASPPATPGGDQATGGPDAATLPAAAAETVEAGAPETVTEEPAPPSSPLEGKSDDEIADFPEVKSLLARRTESVKQKARAESEKRESAARAQWAEEGQYANDFDAVLREAVEQGESVLDRKKIQAVVGKLVQAVDETGARALVNLMWDGTSDDYRIPKAALDKIEAAKGLSEWFAAHRDAVVEARMETLRPQLEEKIRGEERKRLADAAKTEGLRAAEKARQEQGHPTSVDGSASPSSNQKLTLETANHLPVAELIALRVRQRATQ